MTASQKPNIAARTVEAVSVLCPVCGERVSFSPIVEAVTVRSAAQVTEPTLVVSLQPGNLVAHACVKAQPGRYLGDRGTACGRGVCALGENHEGRCES